MPDTVIHPTPQELASFGLGKLPERAAATIAAHLESCPACRKAVSAVSPDSFLDKVRAAGRDDVSFPPSMAQPGKPAIPVVPCPNVPPELARHPKYLILRELGRGGMGVVYQARQTMMNRQVVIKVINRSLLDRPGTLERFRREIQSAAQLSHSNIVAAYDAEQAGELHMLVMEFVPGQSLAEILDKKGSLPVANACHYMRQVALGLQHAHERNMVHRDIKPGNLMLSLKNQIKILDFGLAKIISERATSKGLTSSDAYMGTPDYCAPEQSLDAAKADIRADLYSLGCTLYCLLAGRPPFQEDTAMKLALAHMQKQPQPLTELCPDVPAELWQVMKRLLAKDPAERYQKPIEVFQALSVFVKPGAKPKAKGSSTHPQGAGSPGKGTVIAADTGEIQKVLKEVPGKAQPKEVPAKKEASPFADLAVSASVKLTRESKRKGRKGCVLTAAVSFSLALILLAANHIWLKRSPAPDQHIVTADAGNPARPRDLESGKVRKLVPSAPPTDVKPKVNLPADASVDDLREALKHADPDVQEIAAARLADLGDKAEPAMYALAETLTNAKTRPIVRRNAALAISHIGPKAKPIAPALAQAIDPSEPPEVRRFAAEALSQIKYPANEAAIPAILKAIEKDDDPEVRRKCVCALFEVNPTKRFRELGADKVLERLLDDKDEKTAMLRYDAARKLAQVLESEAPDKTVDVLLEMLANKELRVYNRMDVRVREGRSELQANVGGDARYMAALALSWLGKKASGRKDAVAALKAAAKDPDDKLREVATEALKSLGIH